jgi:DNA-binding transcriptional ArsR family regulator
VTTETATRAAISSWADLVQVLPQAEDEIDPAIKARLEALARAEGNSNERLQISDVADVARRVKEGGPATWLIEGLWPADAYGAIGAADKAGKTWSVVDLAVSVATGTPWLNRFPCPQGTALLFLGEGGERGAVRRFEAVLSNRGGTIADIAGQLFLSPHVPILKNSVDLAALEFWLDRVPTRLVVIDPFYMAAAGANSADLIGMGELLRDVQWLCQQRGSALVIVPHWNQGGKGTGPERFTGVGPSAWGRVLASGSVEKKVVTPERGTEVLLKWQFEGEIPPHVFRMRRRVWADDPVDLESELHYEVEVTDEGSPDPTEEISGAKRRAFEALRNLGATGWEGRKSASEIQSRIAEDGKGKPLTQSTVQHALAELEVSGLVEGTTKESGTRRWWWLAPGPAQSSAGVHGGQKNGVSPIT